VDAWTFNISDSSITSGVVSNSNVPLAVKAFVLKRLKTAADELTKVTVIVGVFPESSETNIDLTIAVVAVGTVYNVSLSVSVKSIFLFLYALPMLSYKPCYGFIIVP
jgi:hypothetical protein